MKNPTNLDLLYQMNKDSLITDEELTNLVSSCRKDVIHQQAHPSVLSACFYWTVVHSLYEFNVSELYVRCSLDMIQECIIKLKKT